MSGISIQQIRDANKKLMSGSGSKVPRYTEHLTQKDINEWLKRAFHSIKK